MRLDRLGAQRTEIAEMAFRVGQKVVCVNAEPDTPAGYEWLYNGDMDGLTKGDVYTIRRITKTRRPGYGAFDGIRLCEIVRKGNDPAYFAARFRPAVERKTDTGFAILTEILNGQRVPEMTP
jgi:hypothetical protein